ncbi:MAG: hypothetical protein WCP09_00535 [Candidatus Taylorbacteria bacterium]
MEPKVVNSMEKMLVYAFFACVDLTQIILDFTGIGEVANHFIDIGVGIILFSYGSMKKLWAPKKLGVLLATFIGEQIPFVNALPFWTLDIANLYSGTITSEQKAETEQEEFIQNSQIQPLNSDGSRLPRNEREQNKYTGPVNQNGLRIPNGGLTPPTNKMVDIKKPTSVLK